MNSTRHDRGQGSGAVGRGLQSEDAVVFYARSCGHACITLHHASHEERCRSLGTHAAVRRTLDQLCATGSRSSSRSISSMLLTDRPYDALALYTMCVWAVYYKHHAWRGAQAGTCASSSARGSHPFARLGWTMERAPEGRQRGANATRRLKGPHTRWLHCACDRMLRPPWCVSLGARRAAGRIIRRASIQE